MDGPPAQSLGVEPVDPAIMTRPPRAKNARVLTKSLLRRVITSATIIMLGTLAIYIHEMSDDDSNSAVSAASLSSSLSSSNLDSRSSTAATTTTSSSHNRIVTPHDTTMTFTCFVLFDMFNALTCRSEGKSILRGEIQLFGNKMFNYAVLGSLMGQLCVIYLPFLQRVFQTEGLAPWDLLRLVLIASSVFWVDEARKWYVRVQKNRGVPAPGYSALV